MKSRRVTQEDVRTIALSLPEAEEGAHMGHADFRVRKKIFATITPDGGRASLRATPENLDALVAADPQTYRAIWGARWLGVDLESVDVKALRALIQDSWALTAPKTLVAAMASKGRRG